MKGYHINIEKETLENNNFRKVLYTTQGTQLVLMSLIKGEDIGVEIHTENDQFFRFEAGQGKVIIDNNEYSIAADDVIIVPRGATHNVINTGDSDLKMYTLYSPPHHKDGTVRSTKEEAAKSEPPFDGVTTE